MSGVAIDARWLWNRDTSPFTGQLRGLRCRDRCSMAVESRHVPHLRVNPRHAGRDRCSMAVESRPPSRHHPSQGSVASRSMLDDCGIETGGCSAGSAPRGGRDRCSMSVESRPVTAPLRRRSWPSRDRCSMAVESRHVAFYGPVARTEVSRSMLDGCGIETCSDPLGLYPGGLVAIDARWLWNRDYSWRKGEPRWCSGRDRCSMAVESRPCGRSRSGALDPCSSRSMLDGCGIETCPAGRRTTAVSRPSRSMLDGCGIETACQRSAMDSCGSSRSMLDGCGIETSASPSAARPASPRSRSMLDGCGIETTSEALGTVSPAPGRD